MSIESGITSRVVNLGDFLTSKTASFLIPEFQRDFSWTTKEVKQLFDDIMEDAAYFENQPVGTNTYLLGNIVLISDNQSPNNEGTVNSNVRRYIVVDGQQRLTVLTLIAREIVNIIDRYITPFSSDNREASWKAFSQQLLSFYSFFPSVSDEPIQRIKYENEKSRGKYYRKIITLPKDQVIDNDAVDEEDILIVKVYRYIQKFFTDEFFQDGHVLSDRFSYFTNYFMNNLCFVVTETPSESQAFQMFEVLNDRGKSLEPSDLIKSRFMKVLRENNASAHDNEEFQVQWDAFIKNLRRGEQTPVKVKKFLKHYALAFDGTHIKENDAYKHYRDKTAEISRIAASNRRINPVSEILDVTNSFERHAKIYRQINLGDYLYFTNDEATDLFVIFNLFNVTQAYPIIMPFFFSDPAVRSAVIHKTKLLVAAYKLSSSAGNTFEKFSKGLMSEFADRYSENKNEGIEYLLNQITEKIEKYSSNIASSLKERIFEGNDGASQIIKLIEIDIFKNEDLLIRENTVGKKINSPTLEHIIPVTENKKVTIESYGFTTKEERDAYVNRLGNFTLLTTSDNSSLKNLDFDKKLSEFAKSKYGITKVIAKPVESVATSGENNKIVETINYYFKPYNRDLTVKEYITNRGEKMIEALCDYVSDNLPYNDAKENSR